jgi:hypothetical protein
MEVTRLEGQLPSDWKEILDGLRDNNFSEQITIELARPALGQQLTTIVKEKITDKNFSGFTGNEGAELSDKIKKIKDNHLKYQHIFNPSKMTVLWNIVKMKEEDCSGFRYPSKGCMLCKLDDEEFPFGFFDVRRGSCGYNTCQVGGSYGTFYIGTLDDIINFSMTDKQRSKYQQSVFDEVNT